MIEDEENLKWNQILDRELKPFPMPQRTYLGIREKNTNFSVITS
jgi:hypothetical protein